MKALWMTDHREQPPPRTRLGKRVLRMRRGKRKGLTTKIPDPPMRVK